MRAEALNNVLAGFVVLSVLLLFTMEENVLDSS